MENLGWAEPEVAKPDILITLDDPNLRSAKKAIHLVFFFFIRIIAYILHSLRFITPIYLQTPRTPIYLQTPRTHIYFNQSTVYE